MSLINYVEPVSIGDALMGLGSLGVAAFLIWLLYRFAMPMIRWVESMYNRELRMSVIEEKFVDDYAKEKGIDLDKEIITRQYMNKQNKSFRRKIEEEMFEKFFSEKKGGK